MISGGVGVPWKKTEMRRTDGGRRMDSKGLATREKGDREEDRGGKALRLCLPSPITPPGRDNWGHRGPVGLASHGFVPSLLSHGYESKNLGLGVYTRLHVYTGCLVRPLKSVARFLEFKIDTITGFSQYSFHGSKMLLCTKACYK